MKIVLPYGNDHDGSSFDDDLVMAERKGIVEENGMNQ
jgi:hypothetical protein